MTGGEGQFDSPSEKTTFKKPSIIRVNGLSFILGIFHQRYLQGSTNVFKTVSHFFTVYLVLVTEGTRVLVRLTKIDREIWVTTFFIKYFPPYQERNFPVLVKPM